MATPEGLLWNSIKSPEKSLLDQVLTENAQHALDSFKTPEDQLAFWINAYNACVMKFIVDRLPIEDVMAIEGFRDRLTCLVAGEERTLIDMESNIIRPLFKNPKVLFALWWGTKGSPRLKTTPYKGEQLKKDLEQQAQKFVESQKSIQVKEVTITPSKDFPGKIPQDENLKKPGIQVKETTLSPLYDWYRNDFGGEKSVLDFIRNHLPEIMARHLPSKFSDAKFSAFDWELDQAKK